LCFLFKSEIGFDSVFDYKVYDIIAARNRAVNLKGGRKIWHYKKAKFIAARMRNVVAKLRLRKVRHPFAKGRNNRVVVAAKRWKKCQTKH